MTTKIIPRATLSCLLIGLLLCGHAQAQIALQDGSTNMVANAGSTTISMNFTVTTGASVLVVSLFDRDAQSTNNSPASLTWTAPGYGAQTISRAVSENNAGSTYADSDIYYLFNPNPGTANLTATDNSGNTPSAMTMQAYTLRGVDTTVAPVTYAANNANATSVAATLSSHTPVGAWAVVNSSYGTFGYPLNVTSSSGVVNCPSIGNVTEQSMGYVANLSAGAGAITASVGSGVGAQKMALAVAVFAQLIGGVATPTNVTATGQLHQVALTWDDASGGAATNYTIYRSTSSSSYTAIATNNGNAATNYTDTAVTAWTTYYYEVTATGPGGVSVFSYPPASATPYGVQTGPPQIALHDGSTNFVWNSGVSNISESLTVTAGASVLVVSLFDRNNNSANNSPASLTWTTPGYASQTLLRAVSENNAGADYADSDIYYLFNPNPGTATITATDTSGNTPSAMTMQAYTLSGVDTTVAPMTYAANNTSAFSVSVTLSPGTPAYAWAVVNSSYGTGPSTLYVASSSGAPSCPEINNVTSQCMGYVANLNAGANTITANAGNGDGFQKLALAVAVFSQLVTGPPAPTNLVATPQANQVGLSWHDASGGAATNYLVFRSTTSDIGYTAIGTNTSNTATNYTDTSVTPWTTYYYVVRAVAVSGTSVYSAQTSAAPLGLPTAPTGLWAIPGNAVVVLNWNNQPSATVFNVLRSTTSGSGFATIATVMTNTCTDTAVVNGTTYYYELNATNSFGTSGNSAQISVIPTAVPNARLFINASNAVRTADRRWFGVNTGVWDHDFNLQHTVPEAQAAGWTTFRYPGGSLSDTYHWAIPNSVYSNNNYQNFATVATNLAATVFITANYGTGTPAEAAGWVADANVTNHYGFKYWEIGNEEYGTWETDSNAYPHDPHCYATNFVAFMQQMKAMDPTIKVGAVVVPGATTDSNGYTNHPATNLITSQVVYGWTPVLLSTLSQAGVTPDFLIHHWYPVSGGQDSDQMLLGVTTNFSGAATDLRGQITGYFGPGGTNIELDITENNNDAAPPGKQSVSLVNALYYADSLGQIMQTEFNARIWYQLHDGGPPGTDGDMSTNLYGWRMYGAFGVMDWDQGLVMTNRYPPCFAAELISRFIGAGDTVVQATSDNALVSAYAALRTNGTLALLAINKQPYTNYFVNIALTNCNPSAAATVYSYGMPQDNAASAANHACDIATNSCTVSANFNYTLPPYSASVLVVTLAPAAPSLSVLPFGPGQFVFQLAGQTNVPYVLQTSTDLYNWTSVSTNILSGSRFEMTNPVIRGTARQFWRALWLP